MEKFELSCRWSLAGREVIDPRLFEVLESIRTTHSLAGAARVTGASYRHVWGLVGKWSATFGAPLAELTRGSGSRLTPFAEKLLWAERTARERIAPHLHTLAGELNRELDHVRRSAPLRLAAIASHDLALAELRDRMNGAGRPALDLRFAGSLDALAALARGACDIAGFHVPRLVSESIATQYSKSLHRHHWHFVHFVTRQQGLIVARGNPKRISGLRSLARRNVRFINRQPGSGTRLLFDALLAAHDLRPARIAGYRMEEFTHAAVAATVASGAADAGFGIEAAARRLEQAFIPIVSEDYYLALRSGDARSPAIETLLRILRNSRFRATISALPGYSAARCGESVSPAAILQVLHKPAAPSRRSTAAQRPMPAQSGKMNVTQRTRHKRIVP
jgi:molybdate transport repressor ModE-like protein